MRLQIAHAMCAPKESISCDEPAAAGSGDVPLEFLAGAENDLGAAEGVGARMSATKSAIVKSVSWPTPVITGIDDAAIARATTSSLKAHRSSSDPPPRATNQHVGKFGAVEIAQGRGDFGGRAFALHPTG